MMTGTQQAGKVARLRDSTSVFLVGNIEDVMRWYQKLGFTAEYYPPGFCILRRDAVSIFFQQHDGYLRPDDPGARAREAWSIYIETDDVASLFDEFSQLPDVKIVRPLSPQVYGQIEFDVMDLNGYRLVFAQPIAVS